MSLLEDLFKLWPFIHRGTMINMVEKLDDMLEKFIRECRLYKKKELNDL